MPPKVEYALTPVARELHEALLSLTDRAGRHRSSITAARLVYDNRWAALTPPP